ncbi:MAG: gliding motility protein GldM [Bacteroidetes bacterium]|nr:gliding motility protein GldM [Bacteroidota bacterium]
MASAKESPRQRLINMMYLVLTAMLALQVSSATLEKFILLNGNIEKSTKDRLLANNEILNRVTRIVKDSGNREADEEILDKIMRIREKTEKIVNHIEGLKLKLLKKAGNKGGKIGKKGLKGFKNDIVVTSLMVNHGEGIKLKKILNSYIKFISTETGKMYNKIALDARDIQFLKNSPNQGRKDFVNLNFYKTPLASALATLSQFASEVALKEADALLSLSRNLGAEDYKMDTIVPVVIPRSNLVASGDRFEAEVVAAASSSSTDIKMKVNGASIPVKEGKGIVNFLVKSSKKAKDSQPEKRVMNVDIEIKNQRGQPRIVSKAFTYFVAKPVIRVESGTVARLYNKCRNPLNLLVPALGKSYNPRFVAKGAKVINKGGGKIEVIPMEKNVSISVYQGKVLLGTEIFKVRNVPKPGIGISTAQGKVIDEKKGIPAGNVPRILKIFVIPNENFKEMLPNESIYKVSKGNIILAYGSRARKIIPINSRNVNISELAALAKPGDRIVVEIKEVLRKTTFGEPEKVKLGTVIKTIPLN